MQKQNEKKRVLQLKETVFFLYCSLLPAPSALHFKDDL